MKTSDFEYALPPEYIAQTPLEPRDAARLLILDRKTALLEHSTFGRLGEYLNEPDILVINDTRVLPARLFARKVPGAGRAEVLLLRRLDEQTWEALVGGKGLVRGRLLQIEAGPQAEICADLGGARRQVRFDKPIEPYLDQAGNVPLPPYIHAKLSDPERYQTVFARNSGSAAAPTAGLHFTRTLAANLAAQGVRFAHLTLHVGLDTFAPVSEESPTQHMIHTEWCRVDAAAVKAIKEARQAGGRVVAVGTTSVRSLESAARAAAVNEIIQPYEGPTDLFILPGYRFKIVDAMITNFHLPRSTLLMLVSAFAGRERILAVYEEAIKARYRFYSFGDAMLIL